MLQLQTILKMIQLLLKQHINLNFRNAVGLTALSAGQYYIRERKWDTTETLKIIRMLKQAGARQ